MEGPLDDPQVVHVLLNKVRLERTRQFGSCWLGLQLWKRPELDRFFEGLIDGREADCAVVACGGIAGHQPARRTWQRVGDRTTPHRNPFSELKRNHALGKSSRCRLVPYLNNIVEEEDHCAIKRRISASLGFRSSASAERTIQGYEAMHMIRKGQVRWLPKGDIAGQIRFIKGMFGLAS